MPNEVRAISCECAPVYETEYETDTEQSPIVAVVKALATVKEVDPVEMDPLYDVIDVEALDQLFGEDGNTIEAAKILHFTVDGWNVFIRADGLIRVCDPDIPADSESPFTKAIGD